MNSKKYNSTLYVAPVLGQAIPLRVEVREALWERFRQFAEERELPIIEERQQIDYNDILVSFRVNDVAADKIYLLSFEPTGDDVTKWGKLKSVKAASSVEEFCSLLGSEITVPTRGLVFKRVCLSGHDSIDISDWEVICPLSRPPTKFPLGDFLRNTSQTNYENIFLSVPKNNEFHIFTQTFFKGIDPFPQLRNILSSFGTVQGPKSIVTAKEFSEKLALSIKEKAVFVFLEDKHSLEIWYENLKIFFDSNRIPTQYIDEKTVRDKLTRLQGVRANIILEMLTKMGKQPIILQPPEEIFINDGFLCLSDIVSSRQRLFGALFTYSRQGLDVKEEVQIYEDIHFETPNKYSLEMPEEDVDLLARKIYKLIGKCLKIDILLTKKWNQENLDKLIKILLENRIEIERVYYISSKTSRFVDEYLDESINYRSCCYPYIALGKRIAFLKTCTETRIYPNLFSLYIELMYPEDAQITQDDLEKILWLVKKRIYRIQEFHVLKNPEPMYIFRNLRKMYLGEIKERLTIPLRLLI